MGRFAGKPHSLPLPCAIPLPSPVDGAVLVARCQPPKDHGSVPFSQAPPTRRQSDSPSLKTPLLSLRTASFGWLSDGVSSAYKRAMPRASGMVSFAQLGLLWALVGPGVGQREKSGNRLGDPLEMKGSWIF